MRNRVLIGVLWAVHLATLAVPRITMAQPPSAASPSRPAAATGDIPEEVRKVAQHWLSGYLKADLRCLLGTSAIPFTGSGRTIADDPANLRAFYQMMLAEGMPQPTRVRFMTPEEMLIHRGSLPRGGDEEDMLFAWLDRGPESPGLILILEPVEKNKEWRVVGIDR